MPERTTPVRTQRQRQTVEGGQPEQGVSLVRTIEQAEQRFRDLILPDDLLRSLRRLKGERAAAAELEANNIRPRNRLLFWGPPGNGKTAAAKAVARMLRVPLLIVNYGELVSCYIGRTGHHLGQVFQAARARPCCLFFDEFDGIAARRRSGGLAQSEELNRAVNVTLMELDAMPNTVMFMAATNRVDILDEAILRRFDDKLQFRKPPGVAAVDRYVALLKSRHPVLADVTIDTAPLVSMSFADIETLLVNQARNIILRRVERAARTTRGGGNA
jgi:SpoVK/Ycf46/Vps4 family AAA+-type ATPase